MSSCGASGRHAAASGCACLAHPGLGRRAALGLTASALLATGLGPRMVRAASGQYEAMLVNCIDPRITSIDFAFMESRQMRDRYSQFVFAGGPIAAVHPHFAAWHQTFWDNLDITTQLHEIRGVVGLTHRDCGAAKLALGDAAVATPEAETASHAAILREFRAAIGQHKPGLTVFTGITALDGTILAID